MAPQAHVITWSCAVNGPRIDVRFLWHQDCSPQAKTCCSANRLNLHAIATELMTQLELVKGIQQVVGVGKPVDEWLGWKNLMTFLTSASSLICFISPFFGKNCLMSLIFWQTDMKLRISLIAWRHDWPTLTPAVVVGAKDCSSLLSNTGDSCVHTNAVFQILVGQSVWLPLFWPADSKQTVTRRIVIWSLLFSKTPSCQADSHLIHCQKGDLLGC